MITIQNNWTDTQFVANEILKGTQSTVLCFNGKELHVKLPKPQVHGTGMQCRAYAIESAKDVLELANKTFRK
tara:strand:- start:134 stop:349 length:216 start_codon:yes stop_codon:yes gene_type:complete